MNGSQVLRVTTAYLAAIDKRKVAAQVAAAANAVADGNRDAKVRVIARLAALALTTAAHAGPSTANGSEDNAQPIASEATIATNVPPGPNTTRERAQTQHQHFIADQDSAA